MNVQKLVVLLGLSVGSGDGVGVISGVADGSGVAVGSGVALGAGAGVECCGGFGSRTVRQFGIKIIFDIDVEILNC